MITKSYSYRYAHSNDEHRNYRVLVETWHLFGLIPLYRRDVSITWL